MPTNSRTKARPTRPRLRASWTPFASHQPADHSAPPRRVIDATGRDWFNSFMHLRLYAQTPVRRTSQLLADVSFVVWTLLWVSLAVVLYRLMSKLAVAGQLLEATGRTLSGDMTSAQDKVKGVPLIGDRVSAPFGQVAAAARSLSGIGTAQEHAVHAVAVLLAVCVAAIPIALVAMVWLPRRVRF